MAGTTVSNLLEEAISKHRRGDLGGARQLYENILTLNPSHVDALRLMSMVSDSLGDYPAAIGYAERAIAIAPQVPDLRLTLAQAFQASGRLDDAITAANEALKINRRNSDALLLLADTHQQRGDFNSALECYQRTQKVDPVLPELYNNWANLWKAMGEPEKALEAYEKAIRLNSRYAEAWFNLGTFHQEYHRPAEALERFQKALTIEPNYYRAEAMLGVVLRQLGKLDEAEAAYQQALQKIPYNAPERPLTLYNLGNLHLQRKAFDQAAQCYRDTLALKADDIPTLQNLGFVLLEQGATEDAIRVYDRLTTLRPDTIAYAINRALALPILYKSLADVQHWRQRYVSEVEKLLASPLIRNLPDTHFPVQTPDHFSEQLVNTGFYLGYQGLGDKDVQLKTGELFRRVLGNPPTAYADTGLGNQPPYRRHGGRKPRLGFISAHLSPSHTIGKLLQGVIQNLSRNRFEIVIFSLNNDMAYRPPQPEQTGYHPDDRNVLLPVRDDAGCRHILREAELDIAYFPDLGMDVQTYLLSHERFAPIQCTTWGHPVTIGSANIDYFISSQFVEPADGASHYIETLVPLENYPFCYERPVIKQLTVSRDDLGLTPNQNLYTCVQSLFKFHPDTDQLFGEILRQDPNGILVLLSHQSDSCNQTLFQRIAKAYPDLMDRIRFVQRLPRADFLGLMAISDVILDSIHFSGGNTSYEGLAFGTPIITLDTPYMKGRLTLGLYRQMGLMDCVASDLMDYVVKAVHYGTNRNTRAALKKEILDRCPILFNNVAPVRELEQFFLNKLAAL